MLLNEACHLSYKFFWVGFILGKEIYRKAREEREEFLGVFLRGSKW